MELLLKFFNWIVVSSIMGSFLVGMILVFKLIFKNKQSAYWHYYIWAILIIRLVIPYCPQSAVSIYNIFNLTTANKSYNKIDLVKDTVEVDKKTNEPVLPNVLVKENPKLEKPVQNSTDTGFHKSNIFVMFWLAGVILLSAYIAFINFKLLSKIKKEQNFDDGSINGILQECKSTMNIRCNIKIALTDEIYAPSLFGILTPVILLPPDILNKVSGEEIKHIILHELSHAKRKDNVTNWLIVILKVLHWFNPILWYGFYRMHEDSEIACDALALSYMNSEDQMKYGYTIIHLLKVTSKYRLIPGTNSMLTKKSKIKRRITMISLFHKRSFKTSIVGAAILIGLSCMFLTGAKDKNIQVSSDVKSNEAQTESTSLGIHEIKEKNYNGKIITVPDPTKIVIGYSLKDSTPDKTTSEIAKKYNALAAVNAGMFKTPEPGKLEGIPVGFIIKDGKVVYNELKNEKTIVDTACFTDKGIFIVGKHNLAELKSAGAKEGVQSGPCIIENGKIVTLNGDGGMGIGPRTAIGQKKDGTVILLVIDGRSKESVGATLKDVQDIFLKYEAYNAALLDGGSSSTMYYNGNVLNHPSAPNGKSGERKVPSVFIVESGDGSLAQL